MKKVKYMISPEEHFSILSENTIVEAYLLYIGESEFESTVLLYFPKQIKYYLPNDPKIYIINDSCASMSFAKYNKDKNAYIINKENYMNITNNKYEPIENIL